MLIGNIVKRINKLLADEQLVYSQLEPYLDEVIDDINKNLNSAFPAFSEVEKDILHVLDTNYNFIPDRYIRSVVCKGAAYKFYIMDEEGSPTAEQYGQDYLTNLFYMTRDYIEQVPVEFQDPSTGSLLINVDGAASSQNPFPLDIWDWS